MENELMELRRLIEIMPDGVVMVDRETRPLVLNPAAKEMLGFSGEKEVSAEALKDKFAALGLDALIEECIGDNEQVTKDISLPPEKEGRFCRCDISCVQDLEGKIPGVLVTLKDITREKEIDRLKNEFVATVSHELRTPLATVKEFASIISDGIAGCLTKEQKEYLEIIKSNVDRLNRLIASLLDVSKIEAGRIELKKIMLDIGSIAKQVISTLKPEADKKHIELKAAFQPPLPNVYADPDKAIQIFTNLIDNAIRYTPENGAVRVEITEKGREVECSVIDTGIGIAAENLDKVFSRFQQFGRTYGPGAKGTGLGLAITKELVLLNNGRIWVESGPDKGSKFTFTLPKYSSETFLGEEVTTGVREAAKRGVKLSLITLSIYELDKLKEEMPVEKIKAILEGVRDALSNSLRRGRGDVVVKDTGEIFTILFDCGKEGSLRVKERLEQAANNYLKQENLADKIKLHFGWATYPDEAEDAQQLINKARSV
jgi:PAS domain S-box-containing protein